MESRDKLPERIDQAQVDLNFPLKDTDQQVARRPTALKASGRR
jgi:hypothetical protein